MNLIFPSRNGSFAEEGFETEDPIVVVGANGSGKSRFGHWVATKHTTQTFLISAQRMLQMPELGERWSSDRAISELNSQKIVQTIHVQSDFHQLLQVLFSKDDARNREYVESAKTNVGSQIPVPPSVSEKLSAIWQKLFPHRRLVFEDNKVLVEFSGNRYFGRELSDGERVAFYLMGKCLVAQENSIVIVDEPELHLHRALMSSLWNEIEAARTDCHFVYLTHDLDFAATRKRAKKLWLKSFDPVNGWNWEVVPEIDEIPEALVLEIVGSRKPILFVEGEKGSYDYEIYQYVYPEHTVIPRGGCNKVIESTRALRANNQIFNAVEAIGLIDRDYRTDEEIQALKRDGIIFADVAEIENLLISEAVVSIVATHLARDVECTIRDVTDFVIREIENDLERQISFRTALEVNFRLNAYDQKVIGKNNLRNAVDALVSEIDVEEIYERNAQMYQQIIDKRSLDDGLRRYTNKGLLPGVSRLFSLHGNEYARLILRLLKTDKKDDLVSAFKIYVSES